MAYRFDYRRVVMRCNRCGYARLRSRRGVCTKCREGIFVNVEDRKICSVIAAEAGQGQRG